MRFFETNDKGEQIWKKSGSFTTEKHIHETAAIKLVYPAYRVTYFRETQRRVSVELILKRGTKEHKSAPVDFYYLPGIRDYVSLLFGFLPPLIIIPKTKTMTHCVHVRILLSSLPINNFVEVSIRRKGTYRLEY